MERELVNDTRRPSTRMKPRVKSPLVPIEDRMVLAEVLGGGIEPNGEEIKPDFKKASGAFAITVPAKEPSEAKEEHDEPSDN